MQSTFRLVVFSSVDSEIDFYSQTNEIFNDLFDYLGDDHDMYIW